MMDESVKSKAGKQFNPGNRREEARLHQTLIFSPCASSASNSRRLGLISRGLPQ